MLSAINEVLVDLKYMIPGKVIVADKLERLAVVGLVKEGDMYKPYEGLLSGDYQSIESARGI